MAGTIAITSRNPVGYSFSGSAKRAEIITIDWVADAAAATVPTLSINLTGWCVKVITNPGSVAPTDNYDLALGDPADSALDAWAAKLIDRDTANTEQVYPVATGAVTPIFLSGTYTLALTNNSVNSATGQIVIYMVDSI